MGSRKGICRLSVMPVRAEPADSAEQVTQLLFGEHYEVLDKNENGKWFLIRIYYDGYEGWIDHRQFAAITEDYFNEINLSNFTFCLDPVSEITYNNNLLRVVMGSVLPVSDDELFTDQPAIKYTGLSKPVGERKGWEFIRKVAFSFLNSPYQWGGRTHFGIDCSGFTQLVFRLAGYDLKRDASQQIAQGSPVEHFAEVLPGDLAFFSSESGSINHVGIILEEGTILHASGHVRVDRITPDGIYDLNSNQKTHHTPSIRRILKS